MGKQMEHVSYNSGPGKSVSKINEQEEADLREQKMQETEKEYQKYMKENEANAASHEDISKHIQAFKNRNKEKLDAAINPENIKN